MKVLIVDDENKKAQAIKDVFLKEDKIGIGDIDVAPSINDAIEKILKNKYHMMIVDMCIPNTFGGKIEEDGGLQLIRIIRRDTRINAPVDIIVLTSHLEMIRKYNAEIIKESFEMINYDGSSEEWKQKLVDKFNYILRYENSPKEKREYWYDVAIITAVPVEREAVMRLSDTWEKEEVQGDSTIYYKTEWEKNGEKVKVVMTSLTQMGMVAAATITSKIIYNFVPRYIIMPGIAGGVKSEYEFGDIIIPKEVKDYSSGKYSTPEGEEEQSKENPLKFFIPSAASISTNFDIINKVSDGFSDVLDGIYKKWPQHSQYRQPQIRTGYMASGDSVVQNAAVIDMMIKNHLRQADGLDMETYGMYYAAQQAMLPKPIPICTKAISDFANKEKNDEHQSYAAYTSANFTKLLILELLV